LTEKPSPKPKVQECRTDEMTSFFEKVYINDPVLTFRIPILHFIEGI